MRHISSVCYPNYEKALYNNSYTFHTNNRMNTHRYALRVQFGIIYQFITEAPIILWFLYIMTSQCEYTPNSIIYTNINRKTLFVCLSTINKNTINKRLSKNYCV